MVVDVGWNDRDVHRIPAVMPVKQLGSVVVVRELMDASFVNKGDSSPLPWSLETGKRTTVKETCPFKESEAAPCTMPRPTCLYDDLGNASSKMYPHLRPTYRPTVRILADASLPPHACPSASKEWCSWFLDETRSFVRSKGPSLAPH